jgi:hypothetical protein
LSNTVVIGQIDEVNATVIAPVSQPSGQPNYLPDMLRAQFAARVCSISVHRNSCFPSFEKVADE